MDTRQARQEKAQALCDDMSMYGREAVMFPTQQGGQGRIVHNGVWYDFWIANQYMGRLSTVFEIYDAIARNHYIPE